MNGTIFIIIQENGCFMDLKKSTLSFLFIFKEKMPGRFGSKSPPEVRESDSVAP